MSVIQDCDEILINETEKKPNLYAANVLAGVVGAIAIVCIMNETGVFAVNKMLMRLCFLVSLTMFVFMQVIVHKEKLIVHRSTKYVMMSMVLLMVLTLTVLLNIHAVLAFVLPLLLATQYRTIGIARMALIGACMCCVISPVLSYLLDTWSLSFLKGYIETFCHVTIDVTGQNNMSTLDAVSQILLYWALPQVLSVAAFGLIMFSATKSGIDSVRNRVQVVELSNDLSCQLDSITSMQERMLCSMSDIIESRDVETGGHVRRTIEVVRLLIEEMEKEGQNGVDSAFCRNVIRSAPMHDLGKISIPDAILRKPGKLTPEEYEIVKQHPVKSAEIITETLTGIEDEHLVSIAHNIALYHHERYDGNGYPKRLSGTDIPLEARIMAIADVYDALVSERCYKAPMSFEDAYATIEQSMGTQFDPSLNKFFEACRSNIESFYASCINL